ncbi:hypothetical protein [Comamonas flocculans]|uniref:Uncharacterized protein n=1 Tax=Comamonas flocculans TaxID=2597701 RepID=A0A5B8RWG9_9BURK|nr:hypothetical protein [Comamonas flocculans]QEA13901.1 hypothetical protein FOZ74_13180 [Comamonas flocculans]
MRASRWSLIAWPAFVVAGMLEMMVFAVLDPETLSLLGRQMQWSRSTVYSISFLIFWFMFMLCSAITLQLARPASEVNADLARPLARD